MATFGRTLRGHITPEDKRRSDYAYIPFDLPFFASRLHIKYSYSAAMSSDRVDGGNVIDLGLFDPRDSSFPGGAGFRGWSGSARSEFFIGEIEATPGYLPGPLPAGRYEVILGLYRIWPQGADYEIEISAEPSRKISDDLGLDESIFLEDGQQAQLPSESTGPIWLRGDLQSHTHHSDAKGSPDLLVSKARALGLDFLAITDHNTVSHHVELPGLSGDDLILIRGQESTTYYGHMNIWNTSRWCDFRARSTDDMAAIIELAHAHGGVCSINHPKVGGPAWEHGFDLDVQAMEVWQGPWPYRNDESLALWDRLLCEGRRLPAVGGSDYHCPEGQETNLLRLGQPTTWVHAQERSVEGILESICAGRTCISASPTGPRLDISASNSAGQAKMGEILSNLPDTAIALNVSVMDGVGYTLNIVADGEIVEQRQVNETPVVEYFSVMASTYIRCELVGNVRDDQLLPDVPDGVELRNWRWALSNPIYLISGKWTAMIADFQTASEISDA